MEPVDWKFNGNSIALDKSGGISCFECEGKVLRMPLRHTHYEVNGQPVELTAKQGQRTFEFTNVEEETPLTGVFSFKAGKELLVEPKPARPDAPIQSWSLTIALPLKAEFHLPEYGNVGRKLDQTIPVADFYQANMMYNFLLVGCHGVWIRFLSEQRRTGRLGAQIERQDRMFLLTVTWHAGKDDADGYDRHAFNLNGRIGVFGSMEEAIEDFDAYLAREVGLEQHKHGNPLPAWTETFPLIVPVDVMRCDGRIENNYEGVGEIARALKKEGAPENTIIHLVGFNGPFDTNYPTHRPIDALGGDSAFRKMIDTIHECGFKFSVHVNGDCIDPHHPNIDDMVSFALRDKKGNFRGYNLVEESGPPGRRIRFSTGQLPLEQTSATSARVQVDCPALCEAFVVVGGLDGLERATITINRRTHKTLTGSKLDHYRIPVPMQLAVGINTIEVSSESETDWSKAWVRILRCFVPDSPHAIATIPLLMADTTSPDYIAMYCEEIGNLVDTYKMDALYVDFTTFFHPNGSERLFEALIKRLPDTPMWIEWCDSLEELGWFVMFGGAKMHLVKGSPKLREIPGRKGMPITRGIMERYEWLDQASPVCDFIKKYSRFQVGGAFVPTNWIASIYDDHLMYPDPTELRENLDGAKRLNFVPLVRINYRKYGIDEHTASYVKSLGRD